MAPGVEKKKKKKIGVIVKKWEGLQKEGKGKRGETVRNGRRGEPRLRPKEKLLMWGGGEKLEKSNNGGKNGGKFTFTKGGKSKERGRR